MTGRYPVEILTSAVHLAGVQLAVGLVAGPLEAVEQLQQAFVGPEMQHKGMAREQIGWVVVRCFAAGAYHPEEQKVELQVQEHSGLKVVQRQWVAGMVILHVALELVEVAQSH